MPHVPRLAAQDKGAGSAEQLAALIAYTDKQARRFTTLARAANEEVVRTSLEIVSLQAAHVARLARVRLAALEGDRTKIKALRAEYEAALPKLLGRYAQWVDPLFGRAMREVFDEAARALP